MRNNCVPLRQKKDKGKKWACEASPTDEDEAIDTKVEAKVI